MEVGFVDFSSFCYQIFGKMFLEFCGKLRNPYNFSFQFVCLFVCHVIFGPILLFFTKNN